MSCRLRSPSILKQQWYVQFCVGTLKPHFQTNVTVTAPQRIIRKSWLKDDNYLGSYSFITPEAAKFEDPFKLMAGPVYNKQRPRILFAGEATHSQIYQTTSGAYLSGEREANRLLKFAKKYQ